MHRVSSGGTSARAEFESVTSDQLPPGKACDLREGRGWITARIPKRHATPSLLRQLTAKHQLLLEQERWVQTEPETSDRIEQPAEGHEIAEAFWHRLRGDKLPKGELCVFVELEGRIVWLVHEDHATQQLCDEINDYLARIVGDGLWRQRWPDRN
jgi:hypothetical protein